MADMAFIVEFLGQVEGPRQTVGYVPCYVNGGGTANYKGQRPPDGYTAMGASGVTIGTGCDLGQTTVQTLRTYGLSDEALLNKLEPYIGKRKDAALRKLYAYPLTITVAQAEALDKAVHGGYLAREVKPAYEKASGVSFDDLPREAQAVIMSCCFQKGCGGVRRDWPKLWGHLIRRDWKSAAWELRNGFTKYVGRRRIEGDMLARIA